MTIRRPAKRKTERATRDKTSPDADPTLWDDLIAIGQSIPKEIRAELPTDLARNFDHYHDGSPKQD